MFITSAPIDENKAKHDLTPPESTSSKYNDGSCFDARPTSKICGNWLCGEEGWNALSE